MKFAQNVLSCTTPADVFRYIKFVVTDPAARVDYEHRWRALSATVEDGDDMLGGAAAAAVATIDFLDAFKSNFNERIEFLENTGLYKAANVCFGLFSVKDSLKIGAGSGAIERLPEFPKPVFNDPETFVRKVCGDPGRH